MRTILNYEAISGSVPAHLHFSAFPVQPWAEGLSAPWLASIVLIHAGVFLALATSEIANTSDAPPPAVTMQVEMIAPAAPAPVRSAGESSPRTEPPPKKAPRPARKAVARQLVLASDAPSPSQQLAADVTKAEPATASPDTPPTHDSNDNNSRPGGELAAPAPTAAVLKPRFDASYLKNPAPTYPPASRRLGEEGRVVLRVLVEADGQPGAITIKTSSGFPRLDHAAEDAVRRWKFVAARQGDEVVRATVLVPVVFNLRD